MNCPYCGKDTRVARTTDDLSTRTVSRERQCRENAIHRFVTVEQEQISMIDIAVRQSGSNAIVPYSTETLANNLHEVLTVKDRLRDASLVESIVSLVELRMTRRELPMRRLASDERKGLKKRADRIEDSNPAHAHQLTGIRMLVLDSDLENTVDAILGNSKETRMARVLYALAVRGRQGGAEHPGWKGARDALEWMLSTSPTLPPIPQNFSKPAPHKVPIPALRNPPQAVIKRSGTRADFDLGRFARTIEKSLKGRRDAQIKAEGVVNGTLMRIVGQSVVHSSQLSVIALEILRATDEIAYLRAAIHWKALEKVTDVYSEALGLLDYPSDQIIFVRPQAADILTQPVTRAKVQ